ncbi:MULTISPECIES: hypothetical protein [unclassified Leisingera]|uniref:hypothetical protein n=1 Tax=unclassified Leisingera TaxID=2614906 RepID=UPI0002E8C741|nr:MULTISPECIES: hypothetical protein [unclassified Leisingera]KIC19602.1 hypothetical protein RA21_03645 [Leisingera sp. ANG-DT]KIC25375.1 hypothetical protein RA23_05770 [Leisingera sp. ANG-S3]KIC29581.1 hypothetical protein RA24_05615 [Leisingera sp. ANG-M6]KIC34745.1 hypothetical protein RA25_02870 [Leisingera sp. ANG-S5]KIC54574.1 hypothetical protein RA22_04280 [Leisingera sp. ANG-S]
MQDALESEELALRRRLLFRLLRGQRFDRPDFKTEAISELVPKGLIGPGDSLFKAPSDAMQKPV